MPITVRQDPDTSDWLLTVGDVTTRVPVEQVEEFQSVVKAMQAVPAGPRVGDTWDAGRGDRFVVQCADPLRLAWRRSRRVRRDGVIVWEKQEPEIVAPGVPWEDVVWGRRYLGRAA